MEGRHVRVAGRCGLKNTKNWPTCFLETYPFFQELANVARKTLIPLNSSMPQYHYTGNQASNQHKC